MHLLIDVRTSNPSDLPNLYYAQIWADTWLSYHRDDRITFLAFEGDSVGKHECVFISRRWTPFKKKLASHNHGPDRIISFSKLPTIDRGIPSIVHVNELTSSLYTQMQKGFFSHHIGELAYKKNLKHAKHIITPHRAINETLSELYGLNEAKISVIPYLRTSDKDTYKSQTILPHGISGEYYISEGSPGDEWNPIGLLKAFQEYIREKGGQKQLIILGDLGMNLSSISSTVRSFGLIEKVKILGNLSHSERSLLYAHTDGWVYIGYYYSRGPSVELANSYELPLLLSDIPGLQGYNAQYIHPNHTDMLSEIFGKSSKDLLSQGVNNNSNIIQAYTRIISD